MANFHPPGVFWLPGCNVRARLTNGDTGSNCAEVAYDEVALAGGLSMYHASPTTIVTIADSVATGFNYEIRQVTAQTTVSFGDLTTAQGIAAETNYGWGKNNTIYDGNVNAGSGNQVGSFASTKNAATIVTFGAFNVSTNQWVSGDQANFTLKIIADSVESTPSSTPVAKSNGKYTLSLSASENSGTMMEVNGTSSTANVIIIPCSWINSANGASGYLTPFTIAMNNPRHATRDLPKILEGSAPTEIFACVDDTGTSIDLTGKTVRFVVFSRTNGANTPFDDTVVEGWQYQTGGNGITVGTGTNSNQVTVQHAATNNATAGAFEYELWNVTDKLPLSTGKMPIVPGLIGV